MKSSMIRGQRRAPQLKATVVLGGIAMLALLSGCANLSAVREPGPRGKPTPGPDLVPINELSPELLLASAQLIKDLKKFEALLIARCVPPGTDPTPIYPENAIHPRVLQRGTAGIRAISEALYERNSVVRIGPVCRPTDE